MIYDNNNNNKDDVDDGNNNIHIIITSIIISNNNNSYLHGVYCIGTNLCKFKVKLVYCKSNLYSLEKTVYNLINERNERRGRGGHESSKK